MKYLLDTDTCICITRSLPPKVRRKFNSFAIGTIGISSITLSELAYGAGNSSRPEEAMATLRQFITPLVVSSYDMKAAEQYGKIRKYLKDKGMIIGQMDTLIAAHALSLGAILVTNNTREFRRVPDLELENWVA